MKTKTENKKTTIFEAKFHWIYGKCHLYFIDGYFYFIPSSKIEKDKNGNIVIPEWLFKKLKPAYGYSF